MVNKTNIKHRKPAVLAILLSLLATLAAYALTIQAVEAKSSQKSTTQSQISRLKRDLRTNTLSSRGDFSGYRPSSKGCDILVDKSARKMTIFLSGRPYRTYGVRLGFTPDGPKMHQGDGRTPEGTYYVCRRNAESNFHKALLISYPSPKDARLGAEEGLISDSAVNDVEAAWSQGAAPPQETALGGNICIHGDGYKIHGDRDWTAGCIAVTNEEIDEVFDMVPVGTRVTILP